MFITSQVTRPFDPGLTSPQIPQSLNKAASNRLINTKTQVQKRTHEQKTVGWMEEMQAGRTTVFVDFFVGILWGYEKDWLALSQSLICGSSDSESRI